MIVRFNLHGKVLGGSLSVEDKRIVSGGEVIGMEEVELLAPACPSKIVCVGLNYTEHARELKMPLPDEPILFLKPPSAVLSPGGEIAIPPSSSRVDFEGELGVVIGKRCKAVMAEDAEKCILGYTCFNDVTARDLQQKTANGLAPRALTPLPPSGHGLAR